MREPIPATSNWTSICSGVQSRYASPIGLVASPSRAVECCLSRADGWRDTEHAARMIDRFVAQRQARWRRLQELLDLAERRRLHRLDAAELAELGRLYRQTTADLATARRDFPADDVTAGLNGLV